MFSCVDWYPKCFLPLDTWRHIIVLPLIPSIFFPPSTYSHESPCMLYRLNSSPGVDNLLIVVCQFTLCARNLKTLHANSINFHMPKMNIYNSNSVHDYNLSVYHHLFVVSVAHKMKTWNAVVLKFSWIENSRLVETAESALCSVELAGQVHVKTNRIIISTFSFK